MKNQDLLTVREFAEAAGVTRQAIYQAIDKQLSQYVKLVDGKKHIEKRALALYTVNEAEQVVDNNVNRNDKLIPPRDSDLVGELRHQIARLEEENDRLHELLREKETSLQQAQALHLQTQTAPLLGDTVDQDEVNTQKKSFLGRILRRR